MMYVYDIHLPRSLLTYGSARNNYDNLCTLVLMQKVIDKLKDRSPAFVPMLISEKILYFL